MFDLNNDNERILIAARKFDGTFSASELIIACWKAFPMDFGLEDFEQEHPDSNKVMSRMMGLNRGLVHKGWFSKVDKKKYRLSGMGKRVLESMDIGYVAPMSNKIVEKPLKKELDLFVLRALRSEARQKFEEGNKASLSFNDFSKWLGLKHEDRGETIDNIEKEVNKFVRELLMLEDEFPRLLSNGDIVDFDEIRTINNLQRHMFDRFSRHLNMLRSRKVGAR